MPRLHSIGGAVRALLDGVDQFAIVQSGAHGAATSPWNRLRQPSAGELNAGAYTTGAVSWQGLAIAIENPALTVREGVGEDGKPWRNTMLAHYGFIEGTRGADGDEIDLFLGPAPESSAAWILNQRNAAGGFDEHKVLAGFIDARQAVDAYRLSYSDSWDRYAPPIPVTPSQLRWWLQFADTTREFSLDLVPPEPDMNDTSKPPLQRVFWDSAAEPTMGQTLAGVLYAIRVHDAADGLLLDPMSMADITEGAEVVALDALVTEAGKLKPKMTALMRVMEAAGGDVKPLAVQFSDLLRRFGGVHVAALFELSDGQTITAWFHNPDSTPNKFSPGDMLVSWKWQLNKKDVTIAVAPESGQDLNLREVARRLMRLATKNSAAFAKANAKRAGVMAEIAGLRETLASEQAVLADLHQQIEMATGARDNRVSERDAQRAREAERDAEVERVRAAQQVLSARVPKIKALLLAAGFTYEPGMFERGGVRVWVSEGDTNIQSRLDLLMPFVSYTVKSTESAGEKIQDDAGVPEETVAARIIAAVEADPGYMSRGRRIAMLEREANAASWGTGSPDYYGVLGEFDLPDDWMPETNNRQAAMDMGEMAKEFGRAIAVQINPDKDMPFRVINVLYPDGRGVGGQWAATAQEAYAMVADAKPVQALVEIPEGIRQRLDAMLSPVKALSESLASARQTDEKFGGSGRYAAEVWQKLGGDQMLNDEARKIDKLLASIGDEARRAAVDSYVEANRARPVLTQKEADYFAPAEPAPAASPEAQALRDVLAGKFDTMALGDLLTKIEEAVKKLEAEGLLQGAIDADASAAITHWVKLDELANG